jgi:hypothetical protein
MEDGRYWVALFNEGGEHAGVERELARCSQREEAHLKYKEYTEAYPNRLVMLCDRAKVLARSDRTLMRRRCIGRVGSSIKGASTLISPD